MKRSGELILVTLNDKPLAKIPVTEEPRPGIMRPDDRNVKIRSMKLTGDWPEKLPEDLMAKQ